MTQRQVENTRVPFARFRLYRLRTVRSPLVIIFVECREKLVGQLLACQNNRGNDYICISTEVFRWMSLRQLGRMRSKNGRLETQK